MKAPGEHNTMKRVQVGKDQEEAQLCSNYEESNYEEKETKLTK